jgi:hypothetical protein
MADWRLPMRTGLDPNLIFPIYDEASACLALLKAECLLGANVVDIRDAAKVYQRAAAFLYAAEIRKAA